jgi:hypothetical protein
VTDYGALLRDHMALRCCPWFVEIDPLSWYLLRAGGLRANPSTAAGIKRY